MPTQTSNSRRPRVRWQLWLLLAGTCAFVEFAGWLATNGRIHGWGDIGFIGVFAAIGLFSLINAVEAFRRKAS